MSLVTLPRPNAKPAAVSASVPAFAIDRLSVAVPTPGGLLPIIHDVSLAVAPGEALGLVGESGCGKSLTFLAALGLLPRGARIGGDVRLAGRSILGLPEGELADLRGRRIGVIFQDPQSALNPVRSIGRQLVEPLMLHGGLDRRAAVARAEELLALVGIPAPKTRMNVFPHQISGGMCQRVMIAIALASEPDVLIADEPTTALDATVQLQVLNLLRRIQRETGLALVMITHDLGVVARTCNRVSIMYAGRTVETRPVSEAFRAPRHPYARALIDCLPSLDRHSGLPRSIAGEVPQPGRLPMGCAFHPRCGQAGPACRSEVPGLVLEGATALACHRPLDPPPLRLRA